MGHRICGVLMLDENDAYGCRACHIRPELTELPKPLKAKYLRCPKCGMRTSASRTAHEAVQAWNDCMRP